MSQAHHRFIFQHRLPQIAAWTEEEVNLHPGCLCICTQLQSGHKQTIDQLITAAQWKPVCELQSQQVIQEIKSISRRCCRKNIQNELISFLESESRGFLLVEELAPEAPSGREVLTQPKEEPRLSGMFTIKGEQRTAEVTELKSWKSNAAFQRLAV